VQQYVKDAAENAIICINDLVGMATDGGLILAANPGNVFYIGVALNHALAYTLSTHLVVDSPDAVFEAQDNAVSAGVVAADIGAAANIEVNAGSTKSLVSGHEINETGIHATSILDVKLLRLMNTPDNAFGPHARIEVRISRHMLAPGVVGI
jgi:hypothetical protein